MPPTRTPEFTIGQLVLSYYGDQLYPARVLKIRDNGKLHLHYMGWNKNHNKDVEPDTVLENSEENRSLHADKIHWKPALSSFKTTVRKKPAAKGGKGGSKVGRSTRVPVRRTARRTSSVEEECESVASDDETMATTTECEKEVWKDRALPDMADENRAALVRAFKGEEGLQVAWKEIWSIKETHTVFIEMKWPDSFLDYVKNDYDKVHKKNMFFKIPAKLCVNDILEQWVSWYRIADTRHPELLEMQLESLRLYLKEEFGYCCFSNMYALERVHYDHVFKVKPLDPAAVFGIAHLIRFLAAYPEFFKKYFLEKTIHLPIANFFKEFVAYIALNLPYFIQEDDYEVAVAVSESKGKHN